MMVKRRIKKPVKIIAILLVITFCIAIFFYQYLFNSISASDKADIAKEMDRITGEVFKEVEENINVESDIEDDAFDDPSVGGSSGNIAVQEDRKEQTITRTVKAYEKGFKTLQTEGNAVIDRLLTGVKNDYAEAKSSGSGKAELAKLAASYTNRAKVMEEGMDSSVNALLEKMALDLKDAGMSEPDVKSYIKEVKSKYKEEKESRRKQIFEEAKKYL
jgi:hypothetical protein